MRIPWNVEDLEIVGYADVLDETMLPSVVPPVFRLKADAQRTLVPPYHFSAGAVYNATEIPRSELEDLRRSGEITLFDDAFPAHAGSELWVDQSFQWHYQPLDEAERNLSRIATEATRQAEDALREGELDHAERYSGVAISADDRRVEPLAIKAAICRRRNDSSGERLMARLAAPVLEERSFHVLVNDYYTSLQRAVPAVPDSSPRRPMANVACIRVCEDKAA